MAARKAAPVESYGAVVTRVYGVVPRPRSSVSPEAWARTKRPGKWRTYYGYRYRPDTGAFMPSEKSPANKFSGAAVAAAMVAHAERGGTMHASEPTQAEKRAAFMAEAVASVTHTRKAPAKTPAERMAESERVILRKPAEKPVEARQCAEEAPAVPEAPPEPNVAVAAPSAPAEALPAEPAVAPASIACACADDRQAIAAAVLREMAASYGPRRAHKLNAMADFVAAHARAARNPIDPGVE